MPALPIGDCIKFGWETFKRRPWDPHRRPSRLSSFSSPPFPASSRRIPRSCRVSPRHRPRRFAIVMGLIGLVVNFLVSLGFTNFALRAHDNIEAVTIWRFVEPHYPSGASSAPSSPCLAHHPRWPGACGHTGHHRLPRPQLRPLYRRRPRAWGRLSSLKESWRITKGNKWRIFLLGLALVGVNLLGVHRARRRPPRVRSNHLCLPSCTPTASCRRRPAPRPPKTRQTLPPEP